MCFQASPSFLVPVTGALSFVKSLGALSFSFLSLGSLTFPQTLSIHASCVNAISWKKMRAVNFRVPFFLPCSLFPTTYPFHPPAPQPSPFSVPLIHWDHPLPGEGRVDQDSGCWRISSSFSSQPFLPHFFPELLHFSHSLREKLPHS